MTLIETILFFFPVFLGVNLLAALPGRESLKEVTRVGLRHFVIGTGVVLLGSALLHLLMVWFNSTSPWFT